jgi:hypothetical protein
MIKPTNTLKIIRPASIGFGILLSLVMLQCQYPYENDELDANKKIVVVDGYLDNSDGPHSIKLQYAKPFNSDKADVISGAEVYVTDRHGNRYEFPENDKGKYSTLKGQLTGIIGEMYQLHIILPDGGHILSRPAVIPPAIEMDTVFLTEYSHWTEVIRNVSGTPVSVNKSGLEAFAAIKSTPNEVTYFRISSNYIEHNAWLEPDTSYLIFEDNVLYNVDISSIHHWYTVSEPVSIPNIGCLLANANYAREDLSFNIFRTQDCNEGGRCPGSNQDYIREWIITVKVHAISPEIYQLYEDQLEQLNATERIYDPIPSQLSGNLYKEGAPEEPVLGMFEVSSVIKKFLVIEVHYYFEYMYNTRILSDTTTLPQKSEYRYGGKLQTITPIIK